MVVVIDPQIAGVAGDMMLSSLVDLGADKNRILDGIKESQRLLPDSAIRDIGFEKTSKRGIGAVTLRMEIEEDASHRKGSEMQEAVSKAAELVGLSQRPRSFAESCINTLILSESAVHGIPAGSVHFHEASGIDTFVDILGTAIALDDLRMLEERILCMPVCVGSGTVTFSHGTMSNPASAILEIFRGSRLQIQGRPSGGELTTPTGACILANLSQNPVECYPRMRIDSVGYGAGQRDYDSFANVLKIVRGTEDGFDTDSVKILETNLDDVSGEIMGDLIEKLMDRGARDASIYHGITKKGRPTSLVRVICDEATAGTLADTLVLETGTLGVRISESDRFIVPRTACSATVRLEDKMFEVSYKKSSFKGRSRFKIEFEDLKRISGALSKPIKETESLLRKEIQGIEDEPSG